MSPPSTRYDSTSPLSDYVLVVDDVAEIRRIVRRMLEFDGHEVITANNALAGFTALLELGPPKLVICDQRMDEGGPGVRLLDYCAEHHAEVTKRVLYTAYLDGYAALASARHVVIDKAYPHLLMPAVRRLLGEP
jgi:DNA-binding NtrC family response regulator